MKRTPKTWALWTGAGVAMLAIAAVGLAMAQDNGSATDSATPSGWMGMMGHGAGHGPRGPALRDINGTATGRFVTFGTASVGEGKLTNLDLLETNATHPLLASASLAAGTTASASSERGAYVVTDGSGDTLAVRDAPGMDLFARSINGTTVTLVLPDGATVTTHDAVSHWSPAGATITYANGQVANLRVGDNATLTASGQTLTVALGPGGTMHFGLDLPHKGHCPEGFRHRGGPREGPGFER